MITVFSGRARARLCMFIILTWLMKRLQRMNALLPIVIDVMLQTVCMGLHHSDMFDWKWLLLAIINVARLELCDWHHVVLSCIVSPLGLRGR